MHAQDLEKTLEEEVLFLTDSLQAGRGFGTGGNQLVTLYLMRQFKSAGLRTSVQSFDASGKYGHNVVGVTRGWFRDYIVIGAYYDGFGTLDGVLYPGADSNASGVAALLWLSRQLPRLCDGSTGLIFVAFDGHNASLEGAKEFLSRYSTEYRMKMMVNLDILGSTLAPVRQGHNDFLIALGAERWRLSMDSANRSTRLDLSYDYYGSKDFTRLFYNRVSEQRWFLEAGIPSVMFTSGITMNTNKTTDTAATLDYPSLQMKPGRSTTAFLQSASNSSENGWKAASWQGSPNIENVNNY